VALVGREVRTGSRHDPSLHRPHHRWAAMCCSLAKAPPGPCPSVISASVTRRPLQLHPRYSVAIAGPHVAGMRMVPRRHSQGPGSIHNRRTKPRSRGHYWQCRVARGTQAGPESPRCQTRAEPPSTLRVLAPPPGRELVRGEITLALRSGSSLAGRSVRCLLLADAGAPSVLMSGRRR